jgi:signal peptidase I
MDQRFVLQQIIQQLVQDQKEIEIPVYGLSMFPFLLPGYLVRIKHVYFDDVKSGDIILFERIQKLVLHRVIRKKKDFIQTKGDSLTQWDKKIGRDDFIALVVAYKRKGVFKSTGSNSFIIVSKVMLMGQLVLGYFFHPLSLIWYKLFGEKIDK